MHEPKTYTLTGADGAPYQSTEKGTFGGYRHPSNDNLYGRLNCWSALAAIAKGHYVRYRVFFADEATAIAAGHRPCSRCMKTEYAAWKAAQV